MWLFVPENWSACLLVSWICYCVYCVLVFFHVLPWRPTPIISLPRQKTCFEPTEYKPKAKELHPCWEARNLISLISYKCLWEVIYLAESLNVISLRQQAWIVFDLLGYLHLALPLTSSTQNFCGWYFTGYISTRSCMFCMKLVAQFKWSNKWHVNRLFENFEIYLLPTKVGR